MLTEKGILYIVATPIGNLADMSVRAKEVLANVDMIAAEDTRHSGILLQYLGINTTLRSLHAHNEQQRVTELLEKLLAGANIALISDAGTPLISDPGYRLVEAAHSQGIRVSPVPGPSAVIAALCASGIAADRFIFEGFLPQKTEARRRYLAMLLRESRTLLFFEAPHRIVATLTDMVTIFGKQRIAAIAREITKTFETIHKATLGELLAWLQVDQNQQRGEFVVIVSGFAEDQSVVLSAEAQRVLQLLLEELPLKQAAHLAAKITGERKNLLYQFAVRYAKS